MSDAITKQAKNPSGTTINFSAAAHRYWTEHRLPEPVAGQQSHEVDYVSVTTLLKRYFPPFDEKAMSEQVAAKRGVPVAVVLTEWAMTRDAASRFGTRTHEVCEDTLTGHAPRHRPETDRERVIFEHGWRYASDVRQKMTVLAVEQIIFHADLRIAGTIDFAARDKDGVLWILDWKTNKAIRNANDYGKTGLAPVAHLPDCEMSKYALQLSLYEHILRSQGYIGRADPVRRGLVHLTDAGAVFMPCADMTREVLEILLDHATALPF